MTKLESHRLGTLEDSLRRDTEREVLNVKALARKLARQLNEIANSDHWDRDPASDVGRLAYKMGKVDALRNALAGVEWAREPEQTGCMGNGRTEEE